MDNGGCVKTTLLQKFTEFNSVTVKKTERLMTYNHFIRFHKKIF